MTTDEESPIIRTSPARMAKGLAIVVGLLIAGAAFLIPNWSHMYSVPPPVSKLPMEKIEIKRIGAAHITDVDTGESSREAATTATTPPPAAEKTDATLEILAGSSAQGNPDYKPDVLTVTKGNTILVKNDDSVPHSVTSGTGPTDPESAKLFDTSLINAGESSVLKTDSVAAGEHAYYCMVHPYMTGTLTVQ